MGQLFSVSMLLLTISFPPWNAISSILCRLNFPFKARLKSLHTFINPRNRTNYSAFVLPQGFPLPVPLVPTPVTSCPDVSLLHLTENPGYMDCASLTALPPDQLPLLDHIPLIFAEERKYFSGTSL